MPNARQFGKNVSSNNLNAGQCVENGSLITMKLGVFNLTFNNSHIFRTMKEYRFLELTNIDNG